MRIMAHTPPPPPEGAGTAHPGCSGSPRSGAWPEGVPAGLPLRRRPGECPFIRWFRGRHSTCTNRTSRCDPASRGRRSSSTRRSSGSPREAGAVLPSGSGPFPTSSTRGTFKTCRRRIPPGIRRCPRPRVCRPSAATDTGCPFRLTLPRILTTSIAGEATRRLRDRCVRPCLYPTPC